MTGTFPGSSTRLLNGRPFGGLCVGNSSGTQETRALKANLVALSASDGHCNEECAGS